MHPIYINGRFLTQALTGVQRYGLEMVRALDELACESPDRLTLVAPRGTPAPPLKSIAFEEVGRRAGHLWEQTELPRRARDGTLLSLTGTGPLRHPRQFITVLDAGFFANPRNFSLAFRTWYRFLVPRLCRSALGVLTISEFSKREIERYCGVPPDTAIVTYVGVDHVDRVEPDGSFLESLGVEAGSYVLCVGADIPNKNFQLVRAALQELEPLGLGLLTVGKSSSRVFRSAAQASTKGSRDLGHVSDAELAALYRGALCLAFPSLYEGFGIPPLEAMMHGCPVIAARTSALPEACGDAALFCDPHDPTELTAHIRTLHGDPAERERLRSAGRVHAARFTWNAAARVVLDTLGQNR